MKVRKFLRSGLAAFALTLVIPAGASAVEAGIVADNLDAESSSTRAAAIQQVLDTGAKTVRTFMPWDVFEPQRGEYLADRLDRYENSVAQLVGNGKNVIFVVVRSPSWANNSSNPLDAPDANEYANFLRYLAIRFSPYNVRSGAISFEIWNEQDSGMEGEDKKWATFSPETYAGMLVASYNAIKSIGNFPVITGGTAGAKLDFYKRVNAVPAAKGAYDMWGVHTDTYCNVDRPGEVFVRSEQTDPTDEAQGPIATNAFLGYLNLQKEMQKQGNVKPIAMTELGWPTYQGTCNGKPPVSLENQAKFISQAYACLQKYPIDLGVVFSLHDSDSNSPFGSYGIFGKPAATNFAAFAQRGDTLGEECNEDLVGPVPKITAPERFVGQIPIAVEAEDPAGVERIELRADGKKVRNFKGTNGSIMLQSSKRWKNGVHTLEAIGVDKHGNEGKTELKIKKVSASSLKVKTKLAVAAAFAKRKASLKITLNVKTYISGVKGKIAFQFDKKVKGKWKTAHKYLKNANHVTKALQFNKSLAKGTWRVKVTTKLKKPFVNAKPIVIQLKEGLKLTQKKS